MSLVFGACAWVEIQLITGLPKKFTEILNGLLER